MSAGQMDFRALNFFVRVEGESLNSMPRDAAQLYFNFRAADIVARRIMCDRAEALGESTGSMILLSAMKYLEDRLIYTPYGWSEKVGVEVEAG